jgi:hypothetical protein
MSTEDDAIPVLVELRQARASAPAPGGQIQRAVDRYVTVIDHRFVFTPTVYDKRRAMELLNLGHTGRVSIPLDERPAPELVAAHRNCVASREVTIAMGLRHDGIWEIADPVAIVERERGRADAMVRGGIREV